MSFVTLNNVCKDYITSDVTVNALKLVSFDIDEGQFVIVTGPSGAGKTTMLNLIGGMDKCTSGEISVSGTDVHCMNNKQLMLYRRNDIGFVFQFYNLISSLSVADNLMLSAYYCKNSYDTEYMLDKIGLAGRGKDHPSQLSGGEQQRVSIARAIIKKPKLLLCDEPTGALDYETGRTILKLLYDICREEKMTVIVATHNSALSKIADKVINIQSGAVKSVVNNDHPADIMDIEW